MVNPVWFFSTLAQAVAAAIGFVIAFTASIYTIQKGTLHERTQRFQEDVGSLHIEYSEMFSLMIESVERECDINRTDIVLKELSKDEIREWISKQDYPIAAALWWDLKAIQEIIAEVPSSSNRLAIQLYFSQLSEAISKSMTKLDFDSPYSRKLYWEVTGTPPSTAQRGNHHCEDIFSGNPVLRSILYNANIGNPKHDGQIRGWRRGLNEFKQDYEEIKSRRGVEWLSINEEPTTKVLRRSLFLFAVGVVLPMMFLVSVPADVPVLGGFWLTGVRLMVVEISILGMILLQTWMLFRSLITLIESESM